MDRERKELNRSGKQKRKMEPPDGGWGWMVVFGSAIINIFHMSFVLTFGMIYGDMIKDMGEGTKGSSLVTNIGFLVQNTVGPISGVLIKSFSCRSVAILGTILATLGVIVSGFSTSLWHLVVVYGVFRGFGMSLLSSTTFVAINSYFTKNKGKAIGFASLGASIGQGMAPYIIRYLMDEYSFQGTTIIMGALGFNGIIGALLLHPVSWHMKESKHVIEEEMKMLSNRELTKDNLQKKETSVSINVTSDMKISKFAGLNERAENINKKSSIKSMFFSILTSMDFSLLKDWRFVTIIVGNAIAFASVLNFIVLTPFVLKELLKLSGSEIALALSVLSGADILGRLVLPIITDRLGTNATVCMIIACVLTASVRQILTFEINLTIVLILSVLHGFGKTLLMVYQNISVANRCRPDQVPSAVGLYMMAKGLIILPFGYFVGWIRDYSGNFLNSIAFLNATLIFVVILYLPNVIIDYINKSKNNKSNNL